MNNERATINFLLFFYFVVLFLLFIVYEVWFVFFMECWCSNQELEMVNYFCDSLLWSDEDDVEGWIMRLRLKMNVRQ
jgi:hypothetical protein